MCLQNNQRSILTKCFWLFFFSVLTGCSKPQIFQQESFVFGTRVEVLVADESEQVAQAGISAVLREFDRLHRLYHAWKPSELSSVNADIARGKARKVTPELANLIREAKALSQRGNHLFDPGIGRLIALWGFQADEFESKLPEKAKLSQWMQNHPGIADVSISDKNLVYSRNKLVALDFGGYLKGWALDRATEILREHGVRNALINIGGNIIAMGTKLDKPWTVGIQNPRNSGVLATLELRDGEAIGTSGDYQRYFELDGKRYPHILDPRTGSPADHTQSVTVLIPPGPRAGTLSDASSKPIFIAGPDAWYEASQRIGVSSVLRVGADLQMQCTQSMKARLIKLSTASPVAIY
jgi:FAD:protein FMN transferase